MELEKRSCRHATRQKEEGRTKLGPMVTKTALVLFKLLTFVGWNGMGMGMGIDGVDTSEG